MRIAIASSALAALLLVRQGTGASAGLVLLEQPVRSPIALPSGAATRQSAQLRGVPALQLDEELDVRFEGRVAWRSPSPCRCATSTAGPRRRAWRADREARRRPVGSVSAERARRCADLVASGGSARPNASSRRTKDRPTPASAGHTEGVQGLGTTHQDVARPALTNRSRKPCLHERRHRQPTPAVLRERPRPLAVVPHRPHALDAQPVGEAVPLRRRDPSPAARFTGARRAAGTGSIAMPGSARTKSAIGCESSLAAAVGRPSSRRTVSQDRSKVRLRDRQRKRSRTSPSARDEADDPHLGVEDARPVAVR